MPLSATFFHPLRRPLDNPTHFETMCRVFVLLLVAFAALASTAQAASLGGGRFVTRDSIPSDYEIVPIIWTGSITPNGENYTFTGTMEEIAAQIKAVNPGNP